MWESTKEEEKSIEKIEAVAMLIATADGSNDAEMQEFEAIAGKIRFFYQAKKAILEFERSGDINKSKDLIKEPLVVSHVFRFDTGAHIDELMKERKEALSSREDYEALIKIKASEITDDFDRKVALMMVEDVYSADNESSQIELWGHLVVSKEWSISRIAVNKWFANTVKPVLDAAPQYDFDEEEEE